MSSSEGIWFGNDIRVMSFKKKMMVRQLAQAMILRKLRRAVSVLPILAFLELAFLSLLILWSSGEFSRAGEQCILDTYEPAPLYESDSEGGIQDVAVVSYQAALEVLELLRLFRPQNPCQFTVRWANGGFLVSREAGHWGSTRYGSPDTASDSYYEIFTPPGEFLSLCVYFSL